MLTFIMVYLVLGALFSYGFKVEGVLFNIASFLFWPVWVGIITFYVVKGE